MISSPISMSHYMKNVQSLLTGGFKVLNVIFKRKFRVKDNTKELCFSDYFYGCFSRKNVRVWGKNVLLMEMNTDCLRGGEFDVRVRGVISMFNETAHSFFVWGSLWASVALPLLSRLSGLYRVYGLRVSSLCPIARWHYLPLLSFWYHAVRLLLVWKIKLDFFPSWLPCGQPYKSCFEANPIWRGAGIAQWLEHRTRDWKVAGSNPCWNGGRIFFSRVDFLCWLLFRYPFHPRVTTVARKKSRSFCQKCRWQVTAKHAYTLRMWILLNCASALLTTCP